MYTAALGILYIRTNISNLVSVIKASTPSLIFLLSFDVDKFYIFTMCGWRLDKTVIHLHIPRYVYSCYYIYSYVIYCTLNGYFYIQNSIRILEISANKSNYVCRQRETCHQPRKFQLNILFNVVCTVAVLQL